MFFPQYAFVVKEVCAIQNLATKCARSGLGVNVWGLADFDSSSVSLSQLMPLTTLTGGKVEALFTSMSSVIGLVGI